MGKEIKNFVENNEVLKKYLDYSKEELEIIRMYINLELITIDKGDKDNPARARIIRSCVNESYNYLDYMLAFRFKVNTSTVSVEETVERLKGLRLCPCCTCKTCIKRSTTEIITEIDRQNAEKNTKYRYIDVIDFILDKKAPKYEDMPKEDFFQNADLLDLMYVQLILETDLISKYSKKDSTLEFDYLDLTYKNSSEYYINILYRFYKNKKMTSKAKLDLNNLDDIFEEKDFSLRIYKMAAYYKYLMENKKIDILKALREILEPENMIEGIKTRARYFMYKSFQKVAQLPYSDKTKYKLYNILNYILNYRYKETTPFIPINILIYSSDKEAVENISRILGEFMWFFGYLPDNMRYYSEYMSNILLDKFAIKRLYYDEDKRKTGILLIHNLENLLYTDNLQQNLLLNILTDEMEKNNNRVCTIIYGDRESLKKIMESHYKLSQMLINLELKIDDLDVDKIYKLLIEKLEKNIIVLPDMREKIYSYIKATYEQSDIQNMEYVNRLYNLIILNMHSDFSMTKKLKLEAKDIPEAYNTRDLPTIMKDINELVGLKEIKEQINDLIALLEFNKKAHIDIQNFNLHMIFSGNPGTGKTTVGRLITDIFYNLGYINQNKLTEVTAKDLIAEYLGQTSGKTFNVVKSALRWGFVY